MPAQARRCNVNGPFDSEVESLTHLTRSFVAASTFAEFPLSSDISDGSMVPGADFQRAHLSSPVPAQRITSAESARRVSVA